MIDRALFLAFESSLEDVIMTRRIYVDMAGDLNAGILLGQIIYWHKSGADGRSRLRVHKDGQAWIAKADRDWYEEVRLTEAQARRARSILTKADLIKCKVYKFAGTPVVHTRINWPAFLEAYEARLEPYLQASKLADLSHKTSPIESQDKTTRAGTQVHNREHNKEHGQRIQKNPGGGGLSIDKATGEILTEQDGESIFDLYMTVLGLQLSGAHMAETLKAAESEYDPKWIRRAMEIAAERNKRRWSYVQGILDRWTAEGYDGDGSGKPSKTKRESFKPDDLQASKYAGEIET